jgi:lipopolysaccharide/colanic/teichoic acid biosynthesis glycosyltransferase
MPYKVNIYYFSFIKVIFDYFFGLLVLFFILPVLIIISFLILLISGWPAIFIQKRTGKGGNSFQIYKFRTMYVGAHKQQSKLKNLNQAPGPMFKIFNDPRFVGIGRFLSKVGLDELPQIFNILKGEMSFVGPRPLPVSEAKNLSSSWNFRKQVKPGIFSEWTLSSNRHDSLTDWKELDKKTLSQGSIIYDIKVISLTLLRSLRIIN